MKPFHKESDEKFVVSGISHETIHWKSDKVSKERDGSQTMKLTLGYSRVLIKKKTTKEWQASFKKL